MTGPDSPADNDPHPGVFELAWLRRTHAITEPVVQARGLCGEIASATTADRVSFLLATDRGPKLVASSATEVLDQRGDEAARLRQIAEQVFHTAVQSVGDIQVFGSQAEPDAALETIGFGVCSDPETKRVVAVVVAQRYAARATPISQSLTAIRDDVNQAATAVAAAFGQACTPSENFVVASWRRATRVQRWVGAAIVGVAGIVLFNIPVPFHLPVTGRLEPARTAGVFAPASGTLTDLHVVDAMDVDAGALLAVIHNPEIELQQQRITGELTSAETELATLRRGASDNSDQNLPSSAVDQRARQVVLRARIESLRQQTALINKVQQSLSIQAPIDGRVMLRDDQADLVGQTIGQSQWLMQIVDPQRGYQAVLELPEKDFGYLSQAMRDREAVVNGSLRLRSSPNTRVDGIIVNVADTVQWSPSGHPVVEVTLSIPDGLPATNQIGATVVGTIDVGRRSLGFVWFRPLIEFFRSYAW
jgi:hypothetical protein